MFAVQREVVVGERGVQDLLIVHVVFMPNQICHILVMYRLLPRNFPSHIIRGILDCSGGLLHLANALGQVEHSRGQGGRKRDDQTNPTYSPLDTRTRSIMVRASMGSETPTPCDL